MIVEHLQMMSVALAHYGYSPAVKKDGTFYSVKAYKNHPCTKWVKESSENFLWLFTMTWHLCDEFRSRYGKNHAGEDSTKSIHAGDLGKMMSENVYPHLGYTPPAQAMPDYCKVPGDPVTAYRNYYNFEKWEFARWDRSLSPNQIPFWWAPACSLTEENK